MKTFKHIFSIALLSIVTAIGVQSCDLEEYNPHGTTADVVFSTPEGIETLVNRMYYNFRWKYFGREDPCLYLEGGTDLWYNAGKASYGPGMTQYVADKLTPTTGQIANVWNRVYDDINLCNAVINRIQDITYKNATEKAYREGEARWLRSYCYWWLCEFFGDIELRLQETSTPDFYAYRTPLTKIYDEVIIPDAELACTQLGIEPIDGMVGRFTRKAAYCLLARVALTRASYCQSGSEEQKGFYQKALNAADYLIQHKSELGVKLYDTYNEIWRADNNKTNTEFLAIVSHSSNSSYNPQSKNPNRLHLYFAPKLSGHVGINTSSTSWEYPKENTLLMPTKYFLELFEEGDLRYDAIFQEAFLAPVNFSWTPEHKDLGLYKKAYEPILNKTITAGDTALYFTRRHISSKQKAESSYAVVDMDMVYDSQTGKIKEAEESSTQIIYSFPRFQKYRIYDPDSDVKLLVAANGVVGYGDVSIMRYAEAPLIAAEACIGLNLPDKAAQYINDEIRTSRVIKPGYENKMKVTASQMNIDFVLAERARELCGEWLRWFDLKRTGKLVEYVSNHNPDIGNNIQEYHNLRPIPATFLGKLLNAEEFGQNKGY